MVKCQSCGTDNPEDSKSCTVCGAAVVQPAPPEGASCRGCGAAIPADSKFCVSCGKPVGFAPPAAPSHCTGCGTKLDPGSMFCTNCGQPLSGPRLPAEGQPVAAPIGDMEAGLAAYWTLLDSRLASSGFEIIGQAPGLNADRLLRRQRFDLAKGGKVTTLCAVKWSPGTPAAESVRGYSQTVFNFGNSQKKLLARSTFQPLVVYSVLVAPACPPEAQAFLNSYWPKHYQAYEFPVVVALGSKEIFCHRSTPLWGMAVHGGLVREAASLFMP